MGRGQQVGGLFGKCSACGHCKSPLWRTSQGREAVVDKEANTTVYSMRPRCLINHMVLLLPCLTRSPSALALYSVRWHCPAREHHGHPASFRSGPSDSGCSLPSEHSWWLDDHQVPASPPENRHCSFAPCPHHSVSSTLPCLQ